MKINFYNYKSLLDYGAKVLKNHSISNFINESKWLLQHVSDKSYTSLIQHQNQSPLKEEISLFHHFIYLRSLHIPIQLIIGKATFYGRDFIQFPDVFIPRPETEIMIDVLKKKLYQK